MVSSERYRCYSIQNGIWSAVGVAYSSLDAAIRDADNKRKNSRSSAIMVVCQLNGNGDRGSVVYTAG